MNTKYDNIPKELQTVSSWVCYRLEKRNGKVTKVPYSPQGAKAKTNDCTTWGTFDAVKSAVEKGLFDGIGFVFSDTPYMGIDIDHCISDDGIVNEVAKSIINAANSYTEFSPSGKGIHIILKGSMPKGKKKNTSNSVEMYDTGRFFTVTGNLYQENFKNVCERVEEVKQIHAQYIENIAVKATAKTKKQPALLTDEEIIQFISSGNGAGKGSGRGQQLADFWQGNYQGYTSDQSSADISLCNALAFWTRCNASQMDRLFRQSGLYANEGRAEKWNAKHSADGRTYGQMTIEKAINSNVATYDNRHKTGRKNCEVKIKMDFPVLDATGKPLRQHWKNTQHVLNNLGVFVRENAITHRIDFFDDNNAVINVPSLDTFNKRFIDAAAVHKLNVCYDDALRNLALIAEDNSYNPMDNYLKDCHANWDGKEIYIARFCEALNLTNEASSSKEFYHTLISKIFIQCIKLWLNDGSVKPVGMLVLQGRQGIGKSRAVKWLMSDVAELLLTEQSLDNSNKDNLIKCTSAAMVEVSEFARSLRDLDAAKQFITSEKDTFRAPYGRASKTYPRRTSFIGTVNDASFLCDHTGNRRFWIIPLRNIRWDILNALPVNKLWGEAYHKAIILDLDFWLNNEEMALLNALNKSFSVLTPTQQTLYDVLDWSATEDEWKEYTPTDIAAMVYGSSGQAAKVGKELKALADAGEITIANKARSGSKLYKLPPTKGKS